MSKFSSQFERREREFYPTSSRAAVAPLIPFLRRDRIKTFAEPCARAIIAAQPRPREFGRELAPHRRRMVLAACVLPSSVVTAAARSGAEEAQSTCSIVGWVNRRVQSRRALTAVRISGPGAPSPACHSCGDAPRIISTRVSRVLAVGAPA